VSCHVPLLMDVTHTHTQTDTHTHTQRHNYHTNKKKHKSFLPYRILEITKCVSLLTTSNRVKKLFHPKHKFINKHTQHFCQPHFDYI
jgi:hypothetical protein